MAQRNNPGDDRSAPLQVCAGSMARIMRVAVEMTR